MKKLFLLTVFLFVFASSCFAGTLVLDNVTGKTWEIYAGGNFIGVLEPYATGRFDVASGTKGLKMVSTDGRTTSEMRNWKMDRNTLESRMKVD